MSSRCCKLRLDGGAQTATLTNHPPVRLKLQGRRLGQDSTTKISEIWNCLFRRELLTIAATSAIPTAAYFQSESAK